MTRNGCSCAPVSSGNRTTVPTNWLDADALLLANAIPVEGTQLVGWRVCDAGQGKSITGRERDGDFFSPLLQSSWELPDEVNQLRHRRKCQLFPFFKIFFPPTWFISARQFKFSIGILKKEKDTTEEKVFRLSYESCPYCFAFVPTTGGNSNCARIFLSALASAVS